MSQVMYKNESGGVRTTGKARTNSVLFASGRKPPAWLTLDAATVPYASTEATAIPNVSAALDHLFDQAKGIQGTLEELKTYIEAVDTEGDHEVKAMGMQLESFATVLNELAARLTKESHSPIAIGRSSNPALKLVESNQTLRLDMSVPGSFNDATAQLGASSIQEALNRLAMRSRNHETQLARMNSQIDRLVSRQNEIFTQVEYLATQVRRMQQVK